MKGWDTLLKTKIEGSYMDLRNLKDIKFYVERKNGILFFLLRMKGWDTLLKTKTLQGSYMVFTLRNL